jgi:predicted nucleotidyltransferase
LTRDPVIRLERARAVIRVLEDCVEGSRAGLRGSLARGDDDPYSDIDVFWELPDVALEVAVDELGDTLAQLAPLESLRSDPLLQNSTHRRLLFAQFEDLPLFWRVDIEVFAESIGMDSSHDLDNPAARGDEWSRSHSALMNGVAALKFLARGDEAQAYQCLDRAFDRIDEPVPDADPWAQLDLLTELVGRIDLDQAERVRSLQLLCVETRASHPQ